jgi:microcystin-dependent protein
VILMSTRKIVPRGNGEGSLGDNTSGVEKYWGGVYSNKLNSTDAIELANLHDKMRLKREYSYGVGEIVLISGLDVSMCLMCLVDGTTGSSDISLPVSITPNVTTIVDGTVTWIVRQFANTSDLLQKLREPSTAYSSGDIRYLKTLPCGWFLEVTTAGTTGSGDLVISNPAVGNTVTDGTVEWTIRKTGTGSGSGGGGAIPLGTIIPYSGSTNPAGFLECNGAAVSRTMYPDLFDCIGTNYGAGDGSTTFNLPDLTFTSDNQVPVFGNGKDLAFTDGSILFGPRTSSSSAMSYTTNAYGKDVGTALSSGTGLTSGKVAGIATKSLLGNTPENSGLVAELTASSNVKYLIKAFDGQTPDSALIDITQYAQALADLSLLVPPGTIIESASNDTQDGYLLCDGSAVSRTTYSALFSAIGTTWGSGDGSTTFNLPNLNDVWLKGSSTAGGSVSAGLPNITGSFVAGDNRHTEEWSGAMYQSGSLSSSFGGNSAAKFGVGTFNASNSNSIYGASTTVQPPSKTVRYMIKY